MYSGNCKCIVRILVLMVLVSWWSWSSRLAAVALLVLQEEQEAFWCLVAVVEAILPQDYYTSNLVASQVRDTPT